MAHNVKNHIVFKKIQLKNLRDKNFHLIDINNYQIIKTTARFHITIIIQIFE